MKKLAWITPLEERISKTPYMSPNSMMRAVSVVTPEFVYYFLLQFLTYGLAYIIGTGQYDSSVTSFYKAHSLLCAIIIRILAVSLAVVPLLYSFKLEYPVLMPKSNKSIIRMGKVCIIAIASSLALNTLAVLTGFTGSSSSFSQTASSQFSLPLWAGVIVYGIVTPVTEEIVHRGLIYNRLRRYYGLSIAIVGSSLIFGLFHGNAVQLVYGTIMGLMIAYIYERYGAFLYPVLFHCVANIVVYICMRIDTVRALVVSYPGILVETIMLLTGIFLVCAQETKD